MGKMSAGIVLYRRRGVELEVFLVHPGGPFWTKKDAGAWSIPKGEYEPGNDAFAAALREFEEETGAACPTGEARSLDTVKLSSGKVISAWAIDGDCDARAIRSNLFSMEWPPKSGKMQEFPEVDRAEWFGLVAAHKKIHPMQGAFLDRLVELVRTDSR
jgi:predicted NUDIX family NTP pyrophosphohydrolase